MKFFLETYKEKINAKIEDSYKQVEKDDAVQRIKVLLSDIVYPENIDDRPLNDVEKSQLISHQFRLNTGRDIEKGEVHPAYKHAKRQADFITKPEVQGKKEGHTFEELKNVYGILMKDLYDNIKFRTDKAYNPLHTKVELQTTEDQKILLMLFDGKNSKELSITEFDKMLKKIQLTQPDLYFQSNSQIYLLNLIRRYIDHFSDEVQKKDNLHDMKDALSNTANFIFGHEKISARKQTSISNYLGDMVCWLQRTGNYTWKESDRISGFFGKTQNGLQQMNTFIKMLNNQDQQGQLFHGFASTNSELVSLASYLKNLVSINATLAGNPLHVMRFSNSLSVFPSAISDRNYQFVDYAQFAADNDLATKVTVANRKSFQVREGEQNVYLALPQYAPVSMLALYPRSDQEKKESFIEGEDFRLQYEPQTGNYRVSLLSEKALTAGKEGIDYVAGVDLVERQKDLPERVKTITLSTEKITTLCKTIKDTGFERLSRKLQESLDPNILKRMKLQLSGEEFHYSSDEVARAIRASVYYSFSTGSEELQIANKIIQETVDGDPDFSFLPKIASDKKTQAKIRVQCGQVAKLYATLMNYLLTTDDKQKQLYVSGLLSDPTEGLSSVMGFKVFTIGHADTQASFTDTEKQMQRFQSDLTPGPGFGTMIDAAKSTLADVTQLFAKLSEIKKSLDTEIPSVTNSYREVNANQENFKEYILTLKREAAESSPLFHGKENELEQFVQSEPGAYRHPDELNVLMQTQPLFAVMNILLYLQEQGKDFRSQEKDMAQIEYVISTIRELHNAVKDKEGSTKESPQDKLFIADLRNASRIGEKISLLTNHF